MNLFRCKAIGFSSSDIDLAYTAMRYTRSDIDLMYTAAGYARPTPQPLELLSVILIYHTQSLGKYPLNHYRNNLLKIYKTLEQI